MEYRSFPVDVEIRSASKRLLCGIVVPYGVNQRIDESLTERFENGAFARQLRAAHRVMLRDLHTGTPGSVLLGRATELREESRGLYGEFKVTESILGDHYLALARDGSIHQWSIGFRPEQQRMDGRIVVYTRAAVSETALVPEGAYGELAAIGAVRAAVPRLARDDLLARLPKPRFPA